MNNEQFLPVLVFLRVRMEEPGRDRANQSRNAVAVFGQLRAQALAQVADGGVAKFLESGQRRTDDQKKLQHLMSCRGEHL